MSRVFISYAHTQADTALARNLESWLTAAGMVPWLDDARMWPGINFDDAIPAAIETADAAIFLISNEWLARDWTREEIRLLALRDPTGKAIPRIGLFRVPRKELEKKALPELSRFLTLAWLDGQGSDADAEALYRIYCGIVKQEPGSPSGWLKKGTALMLGAGTPLPSPKPPSLRPRLADRYPSLECGRSNEFESVRQSYEERYHQVAIIAAPTGEAHDRFQLRIREKIEKPAPIIRDIDWSPRPVTRDDYLERLLRALSDEQRFTIDDLPRLLREMLTERNVILMHRTLNASDYDDPRLIDYYARWLPEQVGKAQPNFNVKCIQPVEWNPAGSFRRMARNLTASFGGSDWFCTVQERDGLAFIEKVLANDSVVKPTKILLSPVMDADVERFCTIKRYSAAEREEIRARTRRCPAVKTSQDVLNAIDDYILNVRRSNAAEGATT